MHRSTIFQRHRLNNANFAARRAFVGAILRHALKLRYWISAGIVGGGITAGNFYEEWKRSLPELNLPDWVKFEDGPLREIADRYEQIRTKWAERDRTNLSELRKKFEANTLWSRFLAEKDAAPAQEPTSSPQTLRSLFGSKFGESAQPQPSISDEDKVRKLQEEILKTQMQYQRDVERLEKENKSLKQRLLLNDKGEQRRLRKIKRSLIDLYSEMLDILSDYDASYSAADNLPRVVVVGDQSAGKTSVLEMVAQARIFPRGSGEMMTRAPVKVTLSEGPYHVAQFRDSSREFDLTKEPDLVQLRSEIELRMRNSVANGKTVSNEVISLTVKGPNLPRIVLVDLPGVISTVTADMARETKDEIIQMCRQHMENPNSIILCIQDGSVDAERSNVTELVSRMNPTGDRTILVLTKVDLAEKNMNDPMRIKRILEGKLFPMKAIGYFGVVTGTGSREDSIDQIRRYEEEFFASSKLFKDGILKPSQMTTRNMSLAVSDCFWRMVRDTIESQADAFRAAKFNLETEWKNTFPRMRELDRDELFDKARSEILDDVMNLNLVNPEEWERLLREKLLEAASQPIFDTILLPAHGRSGAGAFRTAVDIRMKNWAEKSLPNMTVNIGFATLAEVFGNQVEGIDVNRKRDDIEDELFAPLKKAVIETVLSYHKWDMKAAEYLMNALSDANIPDRKTWDSACHFMRSAVQNYLDRTRETLQAERGPGFFGKWLKWRSPTYENLEHPSSLTEEDIAVVRRALEGKQLTEVTMEAIHSVWNTIFREFYLEQLLQASNDCMSYYQSYKHGFTDDTDSTCQTVLMFYQLQKMLDLSTSTLRQQITNTEQRRLEKEVKNLLDDWSQDPDVKKNYLRGRRVDLAEDLRKVRYIQEKLEDFMVQLHKEKP